MRQCYFLLLFCNLLQVMIRSLTRPFKYRGLCHIMSRENHILVVNLTRAQRELPNDRESGHSTKGYLICKASYRIQADLIHFMD